MALDLSCPISGEQRDSNTVRIVAGLAFIVAIVALTVALVVASQAAAVITGLLAVDFIIRAFAKPRYSPLATLARGVSSGLNLPRKMVDSAPKVFAARIGVLFTVVGTVLFAGGLLIAGTVVLGILAACAFLESAFSFCVGCLVYSLLPQGVQSVVSRSLTTD
jgi:hypothetical protein